MLTEAGRTYLPFLQRAFDLISDGTRLLTRVTREDILTVRMYSTFAVRWLVSRLHRFQDRHPDLRVRLMTSQFDTAFPDKNIDLAVMIGQPTQGRVYYEYLFSPPRFPACRPKMITARKRLKRPNDLPGFTILQVHPSAGDWAAGFKATGTKGVDPDAGLRLTVMIMRCIWRPVAWAWLAMQPYVSEDLAAVLLLRLTISNAFQAQLPDY